MKAYQVVIVVIVFAILFGPMSIWTDRTLEFWLMYFKHEPVAVPMWLSMVVTLVCNAFILAVNVLSEVVRLVI